MEETNIDPQYYFDYIKGKKEEMTDEFLQTLYEVVKKQISKAMITGQNLQIRRLAYTLGVLEKEHKLLDLGLNIYVLREHIEDFIDNIADKVVKVIELEFYPREIPDEIVEKVKVLKENKIFDNYYIVYTDYTGEGQKAIKDERKRKDPILFGTFEHKIDNIWNISDRFYYIGDWEDEYCDLTLTKMVDAMSKKGKEIIEESSIKIADEDSIRTYVNRLKETDELNRFTLHHPTKKSFFGKVKTAWKILTK